MEKASLIKFLAASFLAMLTTQHLKAEKLQSYLAPEKGFTKYTFSTSPQLQNYQVVGALKPFQLIINGKVISPFFKNNSSKHDGIWLNGKKLKTKGINKTFYINYSLKELNQELHLEICKAKSCMTIKEKGSPLFIKYPYTEVIYLKETEKLEQKSINFFLKLYALKKLEVYPLKISEKGIISGTFNKEIINLPYTITKQEFDKSLIRLSLKKDSLKDIPITGKKIIGKTNASRAQLNAHNIKLAPNGEFSFELLPKSEKSALNIQLFKKNKKQKVELTAYSPRYKEGFPWHSLPKRLQKHIDFSIMEEDWSNSDDIDISGRSIAHQKIKVLYPLHSNYKHGEKLGLEFYEAYNHYDRHNSFRVEQDINLIYQKTLYKDWGWFYGAEVILKFQNYSKAGHACNFCKRFHSYGAYLGGIVGKRIRLYKDKLEWTPTFALRKSITKMLFSQSLHFQMLSFRYYF